MTMLVPAPSDAAQPFPSAGSRPAPGKGPCPDPPGSAAGAEDMTTPRRPRERITAAGPDLQMDESEWKVHFPDCGSSEQSPINVETSAVLYDASLKPIRLSGYSVMSAASLKLKNNGHTVVLDLPDSLLVFEGLPQTFRAAQLHFHWGSTDSPGSEHTVNGQRFRGEIHVVHYSAEYDSFSDAVRRPGGLAVLAAFIQEGLEENTNYEQLLSYLDNVTLEGKSAEIPPFDVRGLLPRTLDRYYRYNGSLTTPPCFQSVNWTIFNQTISLSEKQLSTLEDTLHSDHDHVLQMNFRLPQSLNGRLVLSSFRESVTGRRAPPAAPATVTAPHKDPSNDSDRGNKARGVIQGAPHHLTYPLYRELPIT
uniref:Carbonic anhydrase n=1 Tax=Leptobrachium leishanense TaxID=445787 RepID=A0A8C5M0G9_9ANUR